MTGLVPGKRLVFKKKKKLKILKGGGLLLLIYPPVYTNADEVVTPLTVGPEEAGPAAVQSRAVLPRPWTGGPQVRRPWALNPVRLKLVAQEWGRGGRRGSAPPRLRPRQGSEWLPQACPLGSEFGSPQPSSRGARGAKSRARGRGHGSGGPRAARPRGLWDRLPHFLPAPTGSRRQRAPQKAPQGRRSGPDALGRTALGKRARGRAAWAAGGRAGARGGGGRGSAEVAPRGGGARRRRRRSPGRRRRRRRR